MRRKVIIGGILTTLGLISCLMLSSVAPTEAAGQLFFLITGLVFYIFLQFPLPALYHRVLPYVGVITFILLLITLLLGKISHGAMRWLPIGPLHLQISEFAKPLLVLLLATYATTVQITSQRKIGIFLSIGALFLFPIFLQPDLGSALVLMIIVVSMLFLSITRLRLLLPWIGAGVLFSFLLWNTVLYGYQKDRLTSFLSGQGAAAYNAQQAYITVGSGKLLGRGLGHGVQSQLRFLPEFHTDFFFASLAEELGLLGVASVLLLYIFFFTTLLSLPTHATSFARLATAGFAIALFFQMAVNIAMNMKLFPITGIPLPLLSSGGSSFLSICIGIGLLVRYSDQRELSSGILKNRS